MGIIDSNMVLDIMMKKSGKAVSFLASEFIKINYGERVPTFSHLSERSEISRGTLQNAMLNLVNAKAIELEKHGHMGTFLVHKNIELLLKFSGTSYISGIMPLPYTKIYEGLATGIFSSFNKNSNSISVDIAYMRGSEKRLQSVVNGRYDFAITSRLSAIKAIENNYNVEIVKDFGPKSYLTGQSVVLRDKNALKITDGMRVGVDISSLDHVELTTIAINGADIKLVNVNYNQIMTLILGNEIDAAVWNIDNIRESYKDINYHILNYASSDDESTAVMVISKNNPAMCSVIDEFLDVDFVLSQQHDVVLEKIYPNY